MDRRVNDDELTDWRSSAAKMSDSGYIWERVRGIGKYNNSYAVRNEIYTAIYIYVDNATKVEGENDPEFTYKVVMHNNNPNNIMDMFDVTFKRVEGESVGSYKITPVIKRKDSIEESRLITIKSMAIGDGTKGRVYIYPKDGKLTIYEKNTNDNTGIVSNIEDIIEAPNTGIN